MSDRNQVVRVEALVPMWVRDLLAEHAQEVDRPVEVVAGDCLADHLPPDVDTYREIAIEDLAREAGGAVPEGGMESSDPLWRALEDLADELDREAP